MTRRVCLALDLVDDPDLIARYRDWHAPGRGWPEVTASMKAAGILDMEIYHVGDRLFMIMEVADGFDWDEKRELDAREPRNREWEELMARFQKPLPCAAPDEKWVEMERIYKLPV